MPVFSVVIPAYNNSRYLPECVHSITGQSFGDLEVIIVDDASTDDTYEVMQRLAEEDDRIVTMRHIANSGTLAARRTGMATARGEFVLLIDQDDDLAPGTLQNLYDFARRNPADIYHYGVHVEASNDAAQRAAAGMEGFLTPQPRTIEGNDILRVQFDADPAKHFDWHVHHKMYRAELAKKAWGMAYNGRLLLSDDLYLCFILDSLAHTYRGVPDSPWYIYHLGRGDTFGSTLSIEALDRLALWESKAYELILEFVTANRMSIFRDDWDERVFDARNRLVEHTMNEWKDNLPDEHKREGLEALLSHWSPDAVCGEIYRYVRDYAYAYFVSTDRESTRSIVDRENALRYLEYARDIEQRYAETFATVDNPHYTKLREIAFRHLRDGGLVNGDLIEDSVGTGHDKPHSGNRNRGLLHRFRALFGHAFGHKR